ncbi:MAG: hypothetical protein WCQ95_09945 [Bacteroidota bacterium]
MKNRIPLIIVASCFVILSQSCKKNNTLTDNDTRQLLIINTAEVLSNDAFKTFLYTWIRMEDSLFHPNNPANFRYNELCMQVTLVPFDTTNWPKTLTITFPDSNCNCNDGLRRLGRIDIIINGKISQVNSSYKISYNNYFVDSKPLIGNKRLTIIYSEAATRIVFYDTSEMKIQFGTDYFYWNANHTLDWVLGTSTHSDMNDDLFHYNGKATVVPAAENTSDIGSFKSNIIQSMKFTNWCFWIRNGEVEIIPENFSSKTVNYADTTCSRHGFYTVNNETFDFDF